MQSPERKPLILGRLMACYDMCTTRYLSRTVGSVSDVPTADTDCRYGFLEQYRTTFRDGRVNRVYFVSARRFKITDGEALDMFQKKRLVIIPLIEPETSKRHLVPDPVADRMYVTVYGHVLHLVWQHLRTFRDTKGPKDAVVISFQDVRELEELRRAFSITCYELKDADGKNLLVPIGKSALRDLEKNYTV